MSWALKPHPLTSEPTKAWKKFQMEQKCMKIRVKPPTKPPDEDKVRFVCMSDTHSLTHKIRFPIPEGDVFLHAGDFTRCGTLKEVSAFNEWIGDLPF
ncbi:unnamed protein product [Cyprideis torosa]|uniref:Uncharacterized protein n=1 Tax=Cyprideis torosa TaxID=163714 RepID=A0A7R8WV31_9CRUS|nr:unnamed protein product [Cyprideis torosa]CAG0906980.1 unnamed protein product [Cyprideis torosa]